MTTTRERIESPLGPESTALRSALDPRGDDAPRSALDEGASRPRAPRISREDVFRAADELLLQGHRPTIDRVRMRLGRGSPNTINDHLDAWWANLGSRLRDLPGREFPHLPERVAHALQALWNEALESAHVALQDTLAERDRTITERSEALQQREHALTEREQIAAARSSVLEDSLALARGQLTAANQRAEGLEAVLEEREAEIARLRAQAEDLERTSADWRKRLEAAQETHQCERDRLESRHATSEARWMNEVDRARQAVKEAVKRHEHQMKTLRSRVDHLQGECETLRQQLGESRAQCKAADAVREHLEARLRQLQAAPPRKGSRPRAGKPVRRSAKVARAR